MDPWNKLDEIKTPISNEVCDGKGMFERRWWQIYMLGIVAKNVEGGRVFSTKLTRLGNKNSHPNFVVMHHT